MKKRFTFLLLLVILTSAVMYTSIIGGYSRSLIKELLVGIREDAFSNVESRIKVFDQILYAAELEMFKDSQQALINLANTFKDPTVRASATSRLLKQLSQEEGVADIYLIDRQGIVTQSSYEIDIGLDLFSIQTEFKAFLESLYGSGVISQQRISLSTITGQTNKYIYYSPPNTDFIIEVSYDVSNYLRQRYGENYRRFVFKDLLQDPSHNHRFLASIDLFQITARSSWSLLYPGKTSTEIASLPSFILEDRTGEYLSWQGRRCIIWSWIHAKSERMAYSQPILSRLEFDFQFLDLFTKTVLSTFLISTVFAVTIFFFLFTNLFNSLFVERILCIHNALAAVKEGKYDAPLELPGNDEITQIAIQINGMAEEISRRTHDLKTVHKGVSDLQWHLSHILDSIPSSVIALDEEGRVTQWNFAATKLFNVSSEEIMGKNLCETIRVLRPFSRKLKQVLLEKRTATLPMQRLSEFPGKILDFAIFPLDGPQLGGLVIRIDDVSSRERQNEQIQQTQKMELVGTLAGGMAHDFNNILAVVIGTVSLLQHFHKTHHPLSFEMKSQHLNTIRSSAERASEMVNRLLTLSWQKEFQPEPTNLNRLLKEIENFCRGSFPKTISLEFSLPNKDAWVLGDSGQLEQALLNLCVNSMHAMTFMRKSLPQNGILHVTVSEIVVDNELLARQPHIVATKLWCIHLKDSGVGIPSDIKEKIFDPFFTTKPKGKGSGLGLSVVFSLVHQHSGAIEFTSQVGKGTNVDLYLPATQPPCILGTDDELTPVLPSESGRILIIDDEQSIVDMASIVLHEIGYQVVVAHNGEDGLAVFEQNKDCLLLIILDMMMPKMSGAEFFAVLQKSEVSTPILVSSGFKEDPEVQNILKSGAAGFLAKPYDMWSLVSTVNGILKPGKTENF